MLADFLCDNVRNLGGNCHTGVVTKAIPKGKNLLGPSTMSWSSLPNDPVAVKSYIPKLRLLTGSYILQASRARFNQYNIDATCALCRDGHESRVHFLVVCSRLQFIRQNYILRLKGILYLENSEIIADSYINDPEKLTQIILACSVYGARGVLKLGKETFMNIERLSRNLCYALHKCRSELLCLQTKHYIKAYYTD